MSEAAQPDVVPTVAVNGVPAEDLAQSNAQLQEQVQALQAALMASVPSPQPKKPGKVLPFLRNTARAVAAAFTSPEVVRQEKSLAGLAITRFLLAVGASAGAVQLAKSVLSALGWTL